VPRLCKFVPRFHSRDLEPADRLADTVPVEPGRWPGPCAVEPGPSPHSPTLFLLSSRRFFTLQFSKFPNPFKLHRYASVRSLLLSIDRRKLTATGGAMIETLRSMTRRRFLASNIFGPTKTRRPELKVPTWKAGLHSPIDVAKTSGEWIPVAFFVFYCAIPIRIDSVIPAHAVPPRRYVLTPSLTGPHPRRSPNLEAPRHLPPPHHTHNAPLPPTRSEQEKCFPADPHCRKQRCDSSAATAAAAPCASPLSPAL